MKATVSNTCTLEGTPPDLAREVKQALTVENPARIAAVRFGKRRTFLPKHLLFYTTQPDGALGLPRGFLRQLLAMAREHGVEVEVEDGTRTLPEVSFRFNGELRPYQDRAARDVVARSMGVVDAPTGSGKTVMGLYLITQRRQPALVIVHTRELLHQWIDRIQSFLGIPAEEIGVIGDGQKTVGKKVTVGIVNSIYKVAGQVAPHIGHLIVDEAHRTPSRTFTEAVTAFDARYLLGLSATPWRRDGLSKLIFLHLGDMVHQVDSKALQQSGDVLRAKIIWRETAFTTDLDPREEYSAMLSELTKDPARNELIARDVAGEVNQESGTVLVLSDRKEHVHALASILEALGVPTACLTGDMNGKARAEALEAITTGRVSVLCATQALVGEGLDLPALSTLFLGTPIRFDGRLIQSVGRVLRPAPGKEKATVYDYLDADVGVLRNAARARARVYEQTSSAIRRAA